MKVCILNIDDHHGGASIAARRLLEAFDQQQIQADMRVQNTIGNHPKIISFTHPSYFQQRLNFFRFALERLIYFFFEKNKIFRFNFSIGLIGNPAIKKFDFSKYDAFNLHWINFGFMSLKSINKLKIYNKPIVWTLHDMWPFTGGCHYSNFCKNYYQSCGNCSQFVKYHGDHDLSFQIFKRKKKAYSDLQLTIVGVSTWITEEARKSPVFPPHTRFITIPNPINPNLYFPEPIKQDWLKTYHLNPSKRYILFLALNPKDIRKGYALLEQALMLMPDSDQIEILVVGKLSQAIKNNKLKVNQLGTISDSATLRQVYNLAEVFVIPSIEDNLPNTILESMACGTPVVGFRTGGIPDLIKHKVNGYLAEPFEPTSLFVGIEYICNLSKDSFKSACLETARQHSPNLIAKQYAELFESLRV